MGAFEFWEKWGVQLSDRQFADAFAALGVLAHACSALFEDFYDTHGAVSQEDVDTHLVKAPLSDAISRSLDDGTTVSWKFPLPATSIEIGDRRVPLASLNPVILAQLWESCFQSGVHVRFQVTSYPVTELLKPWFRLLFEATPQNNSAFLELDSGHSELSLQWPLRLGALPGDEIGTVFKKVHGLRPSKGYTTLVRNADCDIFGITGGVRALLKALIDLPVPQKVNLFIVHGAWEGDFAAQHRLVAAAAETCASGFVLLDGKVSEGDLAVAINRFVENVIGSQTVDTALSEAFTITVPTDPVIMLTEDLAGYHLRTAQRNETTRAIWLETKQPWMGVLSFDVAGKGEATGARPSVLLRKRAAPRGRIVESRPAGAAEREAAETVAEERFLQRQVKVKKKGRFSSEERAFLQGVPTAIRVRIGPRDREWGAVEIPFPVESLPKDQMVWPLTVVLSEPNHLDDPLIRRIKLPVCGASTECEFRIMPRQLSLFEGRMTVLHRGRVLQTAILKGSVVSDETEIAAGAAIEFHEKHAVRKNIGNLADRRRFDLAMVLNHDTEGNRGLTAVTEKRAWCVNLNAAQQIAHDINTCLSKVAKSVRDYSGDICGEKNSAAVVELANLGNALRFTIFAPGESTAVLGKEYIQIVSTRSDAIIPFEFIYDEDAPLDEAKPCKIWKKALTEGCDRKACRYDKSMTVCPVAFWGIGKVIERHDLAPDLGDGDGVFVQDEPTGDRPTLSLSGAAVVAKSHRVQDADFSPVLAACVSHLDAPARQAANWKEWGSLVQEIKPRLLIALPHTDGEGILASLEIENDTIRTNQVNRRYIAPEGSGISPLVALLGCDTVGTALEWGGAMRWFHAHGAVVVIGTIATVFGGHAATVAEMLVKGLRRQDHPMRLGEVLRLIKRETLAEGMLMPLCVVAYGDADWFLA